MNLVVVTCTCILGFKNSNYFEERPTDRQTDKGSDRDTETYIERECRRQRPRQREREKKETNRHIINKVDVTSCPAFL